MIKTMSRFVTGVSERNEKWLYGLNVEFYFGLRAKQMRVNRNVFSSLSVAK